MTDSLYDLLQPSLSGKAPDTPAAAAYLQYLTTLPISALSTTEPDALGASAHALHRSIQSLAKRSHKAIAASAESLSHLASQLPQLTLQSTELADALPGLESSAARFAEKYRKSNEANNQVLLARRNALLLARNADRVNNILELPALLSTAVSSSSSSSAAASSSSSLSSSSSSAQASAAGAANTAIANVNYGSALDLHAHIRRLTALYPQSPLVASIAAQSEREMRALTTALVASLRSPGLKLAGAMRAVGWLRRVAPDLDAASASMLLAHGQGGSGSGSGSGAAAAVADTSLQRTLAAAAAAEETADGVLGALFLSCRMYSLQGMLDALEPLRELAEAESAAAAKAAESRKRASSSTKTSQRGSNNKKSSGAGAASASSGQQTERYLKRYIEIFREQSFAMISMYRSIFPSVLQLDAPSTASGRGGGGGGGDHLPGGGAAGQLGPVPSPLASLPAHLVVDTLASTLRTYLPNVRDAASRDSLMTQVLYCAGSLGRLGGDFSLELGLLGAGAAADAADEDEGEGQDAEDEEEAWVRVMKKHRVQASRLELLASGAGGGKVMGGRETAVGS